MRESATIDNQVTIQFEPPQNTGGAVIESYRIYTYQLDDQTGQYQQLLNSPQSSTATTFVLNDLEYDVTYRVNVAAINSEGEGTKSNSIDVLTETFLDPVIIKPPQPRNLRYTSITETSISVSWSAGIDQNGLPTQMYMIYYAAYNPLSGDFGIPQSQSEIPSKSTALLQNLQPST